jgi:hypothetical protein
MTKLNEEINHLRIKKLSISGVDLVTALLLATGQVVDLNGEAYGLVLDADADTAIGASVDDVINIKVAGAEDFRILANIFRALAGSVIETNTINETTAAAGVTIDSVLVKDGGVVLADGAAVAADVISEKVAAAGVTADGVLLKDGASHGTRANQALTASGAITVGKHGVVTLAHATVVIAATLAAPTSGYDLIIVNTSASGTVAHTVTLPAGVTFDGTNNTATLDAPNEALHIVAVSATRWYIVDNIGSVALSNV